MRKNNRGCSTIDEFIHIFFEAEKILTTRISDENSNLDKLRDEREDIEIVYAETVKSE
jgi:hypothetical protein